MSAYGNNNNNKGFYQGCPGPEAYLKKKMPAFIIICKTTHARRFIKTAQLWVFFYKPAHAHLCIKETEAGRCILNYIAHIHCSLFVCLADKFIIFSIIYLKNKQNRLQ
jgi:hypothetical protein